MLLFVSAKVFDDATLDEAEAVLLNELHRWNDKILIMLAANLFFQGIHGFSPKEGRMSASV
jgi:hypothetical protein